MPQRIHLSKVHRQGLAMNIMLKKPSVYLPAPISLLQKYHSFPEFTQSSYFLTAWFIGLSFLFTENERAL